MMQNILAHGVLHLALFHPQRRKERSIKPWNKACDIVVNNILTEFSLYPPEGTAYDPKFREHTAEEIYNQLLQQPGVDGKLILDLAEPVVEKLSDEAEQYWRGAVETAEITLDQKLSESDNIGKLSKGLRREIEVSRKTIIPWRSVLANFVIQSRDDYQGLDTRLISLGYYTEVLETENLYIHVLIDTSASISNKDLGAFIYELQNLVRLFPSIQLQIYYCDTRLYGPYQASQILVNPKPLGGGGTSFAPFFEEIKKGMYDDSGYDPGIIILTDGYVELPKDLTFENILWVLTATGIAAHLLPCGQVVRLPIHL